MYPSWGNYGAPQSHGFGGAPGAGPHRPPGGGHAAPAPGFGGFEASSGGSMFSSLQEQHRQQMQQLQMLHQKQLQSVLHHGNNANTYGGGQSVGYPGSTWHSEAAGHSDSGAGAQSYYQKDETLTQPPRGPPAPHPGHPQPPPLPAQPHPNDPQPGPPPPEPQSSKPPENPSAHKAQEAHNTDPSTTEDENSLLLQEQQQRWYKQHLQNLQKLKQEKARQNQRDGDGPFPPPPSGKAAPPPPSEPQKGAPPPPPPKEEPPAPPPPPDEAGPEVPQDPEEAARLQQLQAAAAQWQKVQQQRAGLQYQALMQQHEKLQHILEKYQQLIQQPVNLQSMSAEVQLRHFETQQQLFTPLFQDWDHSFVLWYEQFKTYPHKDQLQDYERQWKQWQEQMNATNAHLQERVATLTALVPFPSSQFSSGIMGQFGPYPGQNVQMQQQHSPLGVGSNAQGSRPTGFGTHSESPAGPPAHNIGVRPPGPTTIQPSSINSIRGPCPVPSENSPRFDRPKQGFDDHPRFEQPQQRFEGPSSFDQSQHHFDGSTRFNQPQQRFDGPPGFDQPRQRIDGPPRFDQPRQRYDGPPRFDQPRQRFDGPPRFDQPRQRFDGPPRFDQPRQRFDGPPRFDQPRQRFDGPTRFDQPRQRFDAPPRFDQSRLFGQQPRFEQVPRLPSTAPVFERAPAPQQKPQQVPQPNAQQVTKQPATIDPKTSGKSCGLPQPEKEKSESKSASKANAEDLTDDNLLATEGFFVQSDPIPQTLQTIQKSEVLDDNNASKDDKEVQPGISTPSVTGPPSGTSKGTATQNPLKPDEIMTNNKPPLVPKPPVIQQKPQASGQMLSRPDPPRLPPGRGRGLPPVPVQVHGRGRGQRGPGDFRGPNTVPLGEDMEEMSYDYMPPEENEEAPEEQDEYHWQDPSYEQCDGEELEEPSEEMWMPGGHHYSAEEEYYEEPIGGLPAGRGGPPMLRGGPPMGRGGPPMGRGGPPMGRGGPPMGRGGPPMGRGGPPMGRGGPPMGRGGPPMGRGWPPMGRGGPPMGRGGPPMGRGGPPMGRGGPPMGRGGPPMGRGGPPMGRGGPMDRYWEDPESAEYSEEGYPFWGEIRPPMRGMRPPFPPGRGRPPRGHPGFMHQGPGRPPHPAHGPMDHEPLDHGMEIDDTEMEDPHSHPMASDVGRGRRRGPPPPPHKMMDSMEDSLYDEGIELGWQPPHSRGPPMPPHEMIDSGGMRGRTMGRGMARGMWRPGATQKESEEGHSEGFVEDYHHGEHGSHWRPQQDYHPDDCGHDSKYYESEYNRGRIPPASDYPPRMPPPQPYRDGHRPEERERGKPYPYGEHDLGRGELRIREYGVDPPYRQGDPPYPPPIAPSEWVRPSRLPPPPERGYPSEFGDRRGRYNEHREEPPLDVRPPLSPASAVTNLQESSVDPASQGTSGANVLALSQRQHEIILKAAQELKLIRELQEGKTPGTEPQPAPTDILSELPAGLLGLEIPPDVRNVLKGMTAAAQTAVPKPVSWDAKPAATDYQPSLSKPSMIPKTVDYGHGHELGATVERIAYGERIVLRPDPTPSDRGYEKEPLGARDPYSRDPYYDRRLDPYMDRREYSRERELYREKLQPEYDRDRYERERYVSREKDDSIQSMVEERSPLAPPSRPGYRERERDLRERERSDSRDRDEHYGRPGYDRPPYERTGLDRSVPERYGHSSSPYDRRSFPEDRGPPTAPSLPPPPQPAPRVERKPEIKNIDDILKPPGRSSRPERIVIIMRGLPGSGKSHVAKLIRDKEVDCGGAPPRVLVLDDYFMTEVDKVEKDPDTGRRVKNKVLEYEYEPEMEDTYRNSMLKTFKKTLDDGFFPFIILDTINDRVKHFDQFWSAAKTKGFEVYLAEITADAQTCAKRNVHGRPLKDILKMSNNWEPSPRHMVRLDVRSLLQDAAIEEVEMEDFNPDDEPKELKREEEEEGDLGYIPKSKWEMDTSEAKLDKLDGLGSGGKRKREDMEHLEDYLQLPDDYATRMSEPGKKRVRWADLEEQKEADRKRAIGFVVGQTDWERITDESGQLAQKALNRTKYF